MNADPFHQLVARGKVPALKSHSERAHSKYSASASERWFECQGSVALCETVPSRTSIWAEEGTKAHEVLEETMKALMAGSRHVTTVPGANPAMTRFAFEAASFMLRLHEKLPYSEVMVETRIYLEFIHPEMFGTFDGAVIDHFGTLHVFDYKYGAGVPVSPVKNLQMIFYGIGLAHRYGWNFKRVRLWIIQPRIERYTGPVYWDVPVLELKNTWVPLFRAGVERVQKFPKKFVEGSWCHWCNAKSVCPLKKDSKDRQAALVFSGKFV